MASPATNYSKPASKSKSKTSPSTSTKSPSKKKKSTSSIHALTCPKCKQGTILTGNAAYGCSRWKEGCRFIIGFEFKGKKISEKQIIRLIEKGSTIQLKGFKEEGKKVNGTLRLNEQHAVMFVPSRQASPQSTVDGPQSSGLEASANPVNPVNPVQTHRDPKSNPVNPVQHYCPKCQKGQILKGKSAYGCSRWKEGCDFRFPFDAVRKRAAGKMLTKELVMEILAG